MTGTEAATLLDRDGEREELDRLISDVRAGESRALLLRGEAGIGKTALLRYAEMHAAGFNVIRAAGVEAERELPFAALHQTCATMLDGSTRLPAPQREALAVAFGLSAGSPPDRFRVGLAVLGLFADATQARPLLLLVDDAQWLDRESAQVLGFAARRLRAESIAMIFGVRDGVELVQAGELADIPELRIGGLPDEHARTLLALAHPGPVDDAVLDRIIAESQGNPLALLELPRGFTPAELAGGFGLLNSVALPRRIEESFRRQIATLSPATRQVLLLAAAEPTGDPLLVWRAADLLGIAMDSDLASRDAAARFVEFGSRVTFSHPLLRSAIYRAATNEDRRRAHWGLAQVTDPSADPDRRAWHRAQAATGEDEDVAAELEGRAQRAQARGGPAAAAAFLERAAELTPEPARRGRRLLAAAQARHLAGMPEESLGLLVRARASPQSAPERAQADLLQARLAFTMDRGREAPRLLLGAAAQLAKLDATTAQDTYLEALQAGWFVGHLSTGPSLRELSTAAATAHPEASETPCGLLFTGMARRYRDGYPAGVPLMRRALDALSRDEADLDLRHLWFACTTAFDLWDDEAGEALTTRFLHQAQTSGSPTPVPLALTQRIVMQVFSGELVAADSLLAHLEAILESTGVRELPYAAQLVAVWRGHEQRATALIVVTARETAQRGEGVGLIAAGWMRAMLLNALGRYREAWPAARAACEPRQEMGVVTWGALVELATAASRAGEGAVASEAVARLRVMTEASGSDWALGLLARCRAVVSPVERAEAHYREAIERLDRTRIRGELARAHLYYGEWLRRQSRRREAREQLRVAHTMFAAMGMEAFAAAAGRELSATGETVRKRSEANSNHLTAQETQITRLVRDGLSNAEIGERLFISPRTVEWHLSKIFSKLDVSSRRQLRR